MLTLGTCGQTLESKMAFTINNEDGANGEFQVVTTVAPSTLTQPVGSGMRGRRSLRVFVSGGDVAFGTLFLPNNVVATASNSVFIGFFLKVVSTPNWVNTDAVWLVNFFNGVTSRGYVQLLNVAGSTVLTVNIVDSFLGTSTFTDTQALGTTEHYVMVTANWTTVTTGLYLDGTLRGTASGVPAPFAGPDRMVMGSTATFGAPTITYDLDMLKFDTALSGVQATVWPPVATYHNQMQGNR